MRNIASKNYRPTHQTKHDAGWAAQYPLLRDAMTLFNLKKRERVHLDLGFEQSAAAAHQCNSRLPNADPQQSRNNWSRKTQTASCNKQPLPYARPQQLSPPGR